MERRPRIGITMRLEMETRRFYLGRDYCEAIEAAGGLPVHIPLIPKKGYIDALVAELDGVFCRAVILTSTHRYLEKSRTVN